MKRFVVVTGKTDVTVMWLSPRQIDDVKHALSAGQVLQLFAMHSFIDGFDDGAEEKSKLQIYRAPLNVEEHRADLDILLVQPKTANLALGSVLRRPQGQQMTVASEDRPCRMLAITRQLQLLLLRSLSPTAPGTVNTHHHHHHRASLLM